MQHHATYEHANNGYGNLSGASPKEPYYMEIVLELELCCNTFKLILTFRLGRNGSCQLFAEYSPSLGPHPT